MTIYQQYYTSFRHPTDARRGGGWGVQAQTNGLPAAAQMIIDKSIGYSIPRSLPADAIDQHPIALRYQALNGQAILSCIQSSGKDENGRAGNYFAHTLTGTTEEITAALPPIFYWKSNFWVSRNDRDYDTLPELPGMDAVPLRFDANRLWEFIRQGNRQEWLRKLLCAVIDYGQSKRGIVILDSNDAVAQWIGCVTLTLPPAYHPYLSFATYHHNPYTAPFMIVGTTQDSDFRLGTDEYVRRFVLNAEAGQVSETPASDYASFVVERFNPTHFNSEIVEFFDWQAEYPFAQRGIGSHLNELMNFRQAVYYRTLPRTSDKSIRAANLVTAESAGITPTPQRLDDLRDALAMLAESVLAAPETLASYIKAADALKVTDRDFAQSAPGYAMLVAELSLQKRANEVNQLLKQSESLYAPDVLNQALCAPQVLELAARRLDPRDGQQTLAFWKTFERKLTPALAHLPSVQTIYARTFRALETMSGDTLAIPNAAREIMNAMLNGVSLEAFTHLLELAVQGNTRQTSSPVLEWLYLVRVESLPLNTRAERYWPLWSKYPNLYSSELNADLRRAGKADQAATTIMAWCGLLSEQHAEQIITNALEYLWSQPGTSRRDLGQAMLLNSGLEPRIPADWKQALVEQMLMDATITTVDVRLTDLYERFLQMPDLRLSPAVLGAMEGSLALQKKRLTKETAAKIQARWDSVDEPKYREEIKQLVDLFFTVPQNIVEQHILLLFAIYTPKIKHVFWEVYWAKLRAELLEARRTAQVMAVLDLWFKYATQLEQRFPLITPEFFLELPEFLTGIRDAKGYNLIERELEGTLSRYEWHPLIHKYITKTRRGLKLF